MPFMYHHFFVLTDLTNFADLNFSIIWNFDINTTDNRHAKRLGDNTKWLKNLYLKVTDQKWNNGYSTGETLKL